MHIAGASAAHSGVVCDYDRIARFFLWLTVAMGSTLLAHLPMPAWAGPNVQREGQPHGGPRAYHAMCAREPVLCSHDRVASRDPAAGPAARLDTRAWHRLARLNSRLNAEIAPRDDISLHGRSDFWTRAATAGDCEDYIIAKKQALIAAGWAADQLLYAVVEGNQTPYHAVLIVRTDRGDLVLDNLTDEILGWRDSGYRFVIRQSAANPHRWVWVVGATEPGPLAVR